MGIPCISAKSVHTEREKNVLLQTNIMIKYVEGIWNYHAPLNRFITQTKFLPFICETEYYMVLISNILNTVSGHSYPFHQRTHKKILIYLPVG